MDRNRMSFCPDLKMPDLNMLTKGKMATILADQLFGDANRPMEEMAKTLESHPECPVVV